MCDFDYKTFTFNSFEYPLEMKYNRHLTNINSNNKENWNCSFGYRSGFIFNRNHPWYRNRQIQTE